MFSLFFPLIKFVFQIKVMLLICCYFDLRFEFYFQPQFEVYFECLFHFFPPCNQKSLM